MGLKHHFHQHLKSDINLAMQFLYLLIFVQVALNQATLVKLIYNPL